MGNESQNLRQKVFMTELMNSPVSRGNPGPVTVLLGLLLLLVVSYKYFQTNRIRCSHLVAASRAEKLDTYSGFENVKGSRLPRRSTRPYN